MKKLNNKGVVTALTVLLWAYGATVVGSVALTPSFREKKAISYCQEEGNTLDTCKSTVGTMSKDQVLAYIKDTADRPRN